MKKQWYPKIFIVGVVLLLLGVIDPMEGSIVIFVGALLLSISTYLMRYRQWKFFTISFLLIAVGILFLFYISSLGGIGGKTNLSIWWGLLILPYPVGWLMNVILLILRKIQRKKGNISIS